MTPRTRGRSDTPTSNQRQERPWRTSTGRGNKSRPSSVQLRKKGFEGKQSKMGGCSWEPGTRTSVEGGQTSARGRCGTTGWRGKRRKGRVWSHRHDPLWSVATLGPPRQRANPDVQGRRGGRVVHVPPFQVFFFFLPSVPGNYHNNHPCLTLDVFSKTC